MARDYKKEYRDFHGTPEQIKKRAKRNKARALLSPKRGMEVDHIKPLSRGGTNSKNNLRVISKTSNRKKAAG